MRGDTNTRKTTIDAAVRGSADLQHHFERALLALDRHQANRLIEGARARRSVIEVVESVITPVLEHIGEAWETGTVALSQVYLSGRLCEEIVGALLPELDGVTEASSTIAMATLEDYHLLGKRIVLSALRASGIAVRDFGRCTAEQIAVRAAADGIDILLLSTLMLSTALHVRDLRELLVRQGSHIRLVVGGAPFRLDSCLGQEVGADAVGANSADAIEIVRRLSRVHP